MKARRYQMQTHTVSNSMGSIRELAVLIKQQIDKSLADPETRQLAASIASGAYDWTKDPRTGQQIPVVKYHGRYYRVAATGTAPNVCAQRQYDCETVAIWNFLVLNIRYTNDMDGADTYQTLRATLESGSGDCDDYSTAACALLRSIGYRCGARIISVKGRTWDHVYPIVQVPRVGWVALDMTEPDKAPGWEFPSPAKVIDFDMGGKE